MKILITLIMMAAFVQTAPAQLYGLAACADGTCPVVVKAQLFALPVRTVTRTRPVRRQVVTVQKVAVQQVPVAVQQAECVQCVAQPVVAPVVVQQVRCVAVQQVQCVSQPVAAPRTREVKYKVITRRVLFPNLRINQ